MVRSHSNVFSCMYSSNSCHITICLGRDIFSLNFELVCTQCKLASRGCPKGTNANVLRKYIISIYTAEKVLNEDMIDKWYVQIGLTVFYCCGRRGVMTQNGGRVDS
jgi:hypothetical protein